MTKETLCNLGHDPDKVAGFAIAIGQLEKLAMLKYNINDIDKLRQTPYV